ncbi:MAG: alpha/beta hydrolase family protein [Desulfatibacillaceae bacterium]
MKSIQEEIRFDVDGLTLAGVLHKPVTDGTPPLVVGCHGLFSDGNSPKQVELGRRLNEVGIGFFRLHHRGRGASQGDFREVTSLSGRVRDLAGAANVLARREDLGPPAGFFGSSMGGAVVLSHAARHPVGAVVTLAAPVVRAPVVDILRETGQDRELGPAFFSEDDAMVLEPLSPLTRLLVFHGQDDEVVPVSHATRLYDMAVEPKELVVFPGGDHRISDPGHQKEFMDRTVQWFKRWLAAS